MNKLYSKLFIIIVLAFAMGGCKVDPVVYPEGTILTIDKTNTGIGNAPANSAISYTLDGKTVKFTTGFFQVFSPTLSPPNGSIQVGGGLDPATAFSLVAETTTTGTFDADVITVGTSFGSGKVTFTEVNVTDNSGLKGTIKGTFTGKIISLTNQTEKDVSGSFSIKM